VTAASGHAGHPIFVAYARDDVKQVFAIVERLRRDGFDLWIDLEGIEGATFWSKEIVDAIEGAPVVLFFATRTSCDSENISKELALANEERKPILPILLHDVRLPSELRYQLAGLQRIVWHQEPEKAYQQTTAALARLSKRALPEPGKGSGPRRSWMFRPAALSGIGVFAAAVVTAAIFYGTARHQSPSTIQPATPQSEKPAPVSQTRTTSQSAVALHALVIGNQRYRSIPALANTVADARSMADLMARRGFAVTALYEQTAADLRESVRAYYESSRRWKPSPPSPTRSISVRVEPHKPTVHFIYYAGHAISIDGVPYIVPVDANAGSATQARTSMLPFSELLPSHYGIEPDNRLILYAASPGGMAIDGTGTNSPFVSALLEYIRNDTLDVLAMFTRVTKEVRNKTKGVQVPWIEGSLDTPLFLGKLHQAPLEGITLISVLDGCRDSPFAGTR
jgi:hypothetical protein